MKLSEAMEKGFRETRPFHRGFYNYDYVARVVYACPIAAACVAIDPPPERFSIGLLTSTEWIIKSKRLFPQLSDRIAWNYGSEPRETSLFQMITETNDYAKLPREQLLEKVKGLGY